jgi:hypothetical protein
MINLPKKNETAIFERIDKFIQRLQNKDYIVKPEAQSITCKTAYANGLKKSLADMILIGITHYKYERNALHAITLDQLINEAFMHGVIEEGEGLISKNKKAQERITQLEKENETLKRRLAKATKKLEEYEKDFGLLHGRHFQGDVSSP